MKKTITCHDFHGFKWKNIYPILIVFLCDLTFFLAHDCTQLGQKNGKIDQNKKWLILDLGFIQES
jgi:hypothetical protein